MLGLFAYYVTRPVFDRIYGRVGNRMLAVAVSLFAVALPVLLLTGWTAAIAIQGLLDLLSTTGFEDLAEMVEPYVDLSTLQADLVATAEQIADDPNRSLPSAVTASGTSSRRCWGPSCCCSTSSSSCSSWSSSPSTCCGTTTGRPPGPETRSRRGGSVVERYLVAVDRDLKNVYFGNILNAMVTGVLGAVVYISLNLVAPDAVAIPEPVLLGLLTGAAEPDSRHRDEAGLDSHRRPLVRRFAGDRPATAWFPVLFAAVSTVVIDYIPDQLLRPYVSGRSLHVGAIMLAYIVGPLLFGWYGLFLGPLVLVVIFEFARIVVPWLAHPEQEAGPARPGESSAVRSASGVLRAFRPRCSGHARRVGVGRGRGTSRRLTEPSVGGSRSR